MIKHPPQREMWEGLDGKGCLSLVLLLVVITIIGALLG